MPRLKKRADGRYQRRKMINGKSVVFYGKTVAEIDEKIERYERRANASLTFREIAEQWKADCWDELSITTQKGYTKAYERAVECFGDRYAEEITVPDVNNYLKEFISRKFSLKTVQAQKGVISVVYRHAILRGDVKHNPATGFSLPRNLPKSQRLPPSEEDIYKIAHGEYEWLLPRILIYTGMRRGEVLALDWQDFDRKKKTITVNKVIVFDNNQPILKHRTKTTAGEREIPLLDALARYLPPNSSGRLFEYNYSTLRSLWQKWQKSLGVECTMHQLRHAYASILLDAGVTPKDAQHLLGHSNVAITQNVYTHILKSRAEQTAEKINAFFSAK